MNPILTRALPYILVVVAVASAVFLIRQSGVDAEATRRDLQAKTEQVQGLQQSLRAFKQRQEQTSAIAEKAVKTNTVIRTVTKEITREVPILVPADVPPLPGGWRLLHDAAATGAALDPAAPGGADAAPTSAQDAASTVIENYGTYHQLANEHRLLQEWVNTVCK